MAVRSFYAALILFLGPVVAQRQPSATPDAVPSASADDSQRTGSTQSVIKQLEARQERGPSAPPEGFQYFQGEGYRFLVPAPMELEGREGDMTRVSVMGTRMLVLAGDPVPEEAAPDNEHLKNSSWQGQYTSGRKATFGSRRGWISEVRGNNYMGSSALIFGQGRTIRIDCVNQQEQLITSGKESYQQQRLYLSKALAQSDDRKNTEAMCQRLFQSVELEEDAPDLAPQSTLYDRAKAARSAAVLQPASPETAPTAGMSLGDLGRRQRALPRKPAAASFEATGDPDKVPAGFRWLGLSEVCRPDCSRARMLIPTAAIVVPDHPEVYEMTLDHAVVSLFAGRLRTWTGVGSLPPSLWIQEKFANPMFGVTLSTSPTVTPLYEEDKIIRGQTAKISRVMLVDPAGNVFLGEGAVFKISGDIGIGCLIPENKFGEFEPVCERMIDSLQVE
ncbi:MAG TPA: hypothetical protein VKW06_10745 [Candidatus Angelobacter sp.]|nr:hypothetical protein [Candidatus Angelobacter sp.]